MAKRYRKTLFTVLIVGEGETEKAFLEYLRELYVCRGCGTKTTIKNAHGKSPKHILDIAIRQNRNKDFDRTILFLDTDVPWPVDVIKKAANNRYIMIGNSPCIEGLFLEILGKRTPDNTQECKLALRDIVENKCLTNKASYNDVFSLKILDESRKKIVQFNKLIAKMTK